MFRRLESSLPLDFYFPADLEQLGYFVNDKDQIRMISDPKQKFHYYISKNERCIEMHKEAMNECTRQIVKQRLLDRDLEQRTLPLGTPLDEPHVPILTSKDLKSCKRLIVYLGESFQDLGILAGRIISNDSINEGSLVGLVDTIQKSLYLQSENTGIVIANLGQLMWYRRDRKAVSWSSWMATPRKFAVGAPLESTKKNRVPQNEDHEKHVACVLEEVVLPLANDGCSVFVIGAGDGGTAAFQYLQANWSSTWKDKIEALVITGLNFVPLPRFEVDDFRNWWARRGRAYLLSDQPLLTPLQGRSRLGCNIFSSGEQYYLECILRCAHVVIIDYFKFIMQHEGYENPPQNLGDPDAESPEETPPPSWAWGPADAVDETEEYYTANEMVKSGSTEYTDAPETSDEYHKRHERRSSFMHEREDGTLDLDGATYVAGSAFSSDSSNLADNEATSETSDELKCSRELARSMPPNSATLKGKNVGTKRTLVLRPMEGTDTVDQSPDPAAQAGESSHLHKNRAKNTGTRRTLVLRPMQVTDTVNQSPDLAAQAGESSQLHDNRDQTPRLIDTAGDYTLDSTTKEGNSSRSKEQAGLDEGGRPINDISEDEVLANIQNRTRWRYQRLPDTDISDEQRQNTHTAENEVKSCDEGTLSTDSQDGGVRLSAGPDILDK